MCVFRKHQLVCVWMLRRDVCVVEGEDMVVVVVVAVAVVVVEGSKSAVIQALLSLLNDDVNL